jgi:hypothetical protein
MSASFTDDAACVSLSSNHNVKQLETFVSYPLRGAQITARWPGGFRCSGAFLEESGVSKDRLVSCQPLFCISVSVVQCLAEPLNRQKDTEATSSPWLAPGRLKSLRPVDGQLLARGFSARKRASAASRALKQACLRSVFASLNRKPSKMGFDDRLMTCARHCSDTFGFCSRVAQ